VASQVIFLALLGVGVIALVLVAAAMSLFFRRRDPDRTVGGRHLLGSRSGMSQT